MFRSVVACVWQLSGTGGIGQPAALLAGLTGLTVAVRLTSAYRTDAEGLAAAMGNYLGLATAFNIY